MVVANIFPHLPPPQEAHEIIPNLSAREIQDIVAVTTKQSCPQGIFIGGNISTGFINDPHQGQLVNCAGEAIPDLCPSSLRSFSIAFFEADVVPGVTRFPTQSPNVNGSLPQLLRSELLRISIAQRSVSSLKLL